MARRSTMFCRYPGCGVLVTAKYCATHTPLHAEEDRGRDQRRGSAHSRGYTYRWSKYSKRFLSLPNNQFCALHLDAGCAGIAQCVDHIQPHNGQQDPLFWDQRNHQPACIHCNSVKGSKTITGAYVFGQTINQQTR